MIEYPINSEEFCHARAKEFSLAIAFDCKEVNSQNIDDILLTAQKVYEWYIKGIEHEFKIVNLNK